MPNGNFCIFVRAHYDLAILLLNLINSDYYLNEFLQKISAGESEEFAYKLIPNVYSGNYLKSKNHINVMDLLLGM